MGKKRKVTRRDTRERLSEIRLSVELVKVIRHFFPDLIQLLRQTPDPRHQSYITYQGSVILMVRILASIFYISSMRKTSEEFNSQEVIENVGYLCNEPELIELPYWETINDYLKRLDPAVLQEIVCQLIRRLLRSRAFEGSRIRDRYWQIIIDGTQLESSRKELDPRALYRIHKKGTEEEYKESYYYVLEAKIVLHPKVIVSIMTEFVENEGSEVTKQDCELKACWRLMERLKQSFPMLPICLCGDSLYAGEPFFNRCRENHWKYLLRFKPGSIPSVYEEYETIRQVESNRREEGHKDERVWYDYVTGIDYNGQALNVAEYGGSERKYSMYFITDLSINSRNIRVLVESGRRRWKIENEGFNTQKNQGYNLEHMFSKNYQGMKNHYYLIQLGHMIAQIMEAWEKLWEKMKQSMEQKHKRVLESWKKEKLVDHSEECNRRIQIRFA